ADVLEDPLLLRRYAFSALKNVKDLAEVVRSTAIYDMELNLANSTSFQTKFARLMGDAGRMCGTCAECKKTRLCANLSWLKLLRPSEGPEGFWKQPPELRKAVYICTHLFSIARRQATEDLLSHPLRPDINQPS